MLIFSITRGTAPLRWTACTFIGTTACWTTQVLVFFFVVSCIHLFCSRVSWSSSFCRFVSFLCFLVSVCWVGFLAVLLVAVVVCGVRLSLLLVRLSPCFAWWSFSFFLVLLFSCVSVSCVVVSRCWSRVFSRHPALPFLLDLFVSRCCRPSTLCLLLFLFAFVPAKLVVA